VKRASSAKSSEPAPHSTPMAPLPVKKKYFSGNDASGAMHLQEEMGVERIKWGNPGHGWPMGIICTMHSRIRVARGIQVNLFGEDSRTWNRDA